MSPQNYSLKKKQKVIKALSDSKLLISDKDRDKYVAAFVTELKGGLAGRKSSLKLLPSFVKFASKITSRDKIAVIECGQVTLSKGSFQQNGEKYNVQEVMGYPMPGLGKETSMEYFYKQIIFNARDVLRSTNKIGLCFRHPIEANAKGDGKLLKWARESINVSELVGKFIGEEFKKYLKEEFEREYKIIVLNDTVATLIAGLGETWDKEFEDFIGLVHSRGYNLAYIEDGRELKGILADTKYLKSQMVLNTQAGGFSKVENSLVDKEVHALLGKMSVGEFSQKVNSECLPLALKVIAKEFSGKLLSPKISKRLLEMEDLDLEQMEAFIRCGLKSNSEIASFFRFATLDDAVNLGIIIDQILERAARLVAIQISGILKYKNIGHNVLQPVGIIVEGEFFDLVRDFEDRVRCEIFQYFGKSDPRFIRFLNVPNATLLGTGIAAAINL